MEDDDLPPDLLKLVEQDEKQILPHQEVTKAINLRTEKERKEVKIGTMLSPATGKELIDLLQDYNDVFAWSYQDMPGLDTDIVVHHLPLREECATIKQKLRRDKPEMLLKIMEEVKIGTTLSSATRKELIDLLQGYNDVFAWSYQDMPDLDTDIVVHRLPLREECMPIKQKLRRVKPKMLLKIKKKVKKQLDAGFLEVAKYPQWVANIVSISKKDGKVRMCVDYRDLNRASPKDNFLLPHIDTLVEIGRAHV